MSTEVQRRPRTIPSPARPPRIASSLDGLRSGRQLQLNRRVRLEAQLLPFSEDVLVHAPRRTEDAEPDAERPRDLAERHADRTESDEAADTAREILAAAGRRRGRADTGRTALEPLTAFALIH